MVDPVVPRRMRGPDLATLRASDQIRDHGLRVGDLCAHIAIGVSERGIGILRTAAFLHDIGKLEPKLRDILLANRPLTEEEVVAFRAHVDFGVDYLRRSSAGVNNDQVIRLVAEHHERWDGTGYPNGVAGPDQDPLTKYLVVADALDVMRTGRPYQPARSVADTITELEQGAGTQFSPEVVAHAVAWLRGQADG